MEVSLVRAAGTILAVKEQQLAKTSGIIIGFLKKPTSKGFLNNICCF
jgi:hypothetical protein